MTFRTAFSARSLFVVAGSCLALGQRAGAIGLTWNNALGGSAATATNWNPNQVPTAADDLTFALNAVYSVSFPSSVPTSRTHVYRSGTVTGSFNGHTITSQLYVGQVSGNNATLTVGGTLTSTNFVTIGRDGGAVGTMNLVASTAVLHVSGATFDLIVGQAGQGTLNVTGGAGIDIEGSADDFIIGNLATGVGTVSLTGAATNVSDIAVNNTAGGDLVIGSLGSGSVNLNNNSQLSAGTDMYLAQGTGSTGTLTMLDNTGSTHATVRVQRDLHVAHNLSGTAAAGLGTLTMNQGAQVTVGLSLLNTGTLFIGDSNGGTGTVNLNNGLLATENLVIDPVNGHLNHTGGELRITAGGNYTRGTILAVNSVSPSNVPVLHFQGSTGTLGDGFLIGDSQSGAMLIDGGAVVSTALGSGSTLATIAANGPASVGTITVTGAGSRLNISGLPNSFIIGNRGDGTLNISNGGTVHTTRPVILCSLADSSANAVIQSGGVLNCGDLLIGSSAPATMSVISGGGVSCGDFTVSGGSTIAVDAASVAASGTATIAGAATLGHSATITAPSISVTGTAQGSGALLGNVTIAPGGVITVSADALTLGNAASATGFTNSGTLNVGSNSATLLDASLAAAGTVTINGGVLAAARGMSLTSLTGNGTVTGEVTMHSGSVTSTLVQGLLFSDTFTGTGWSMSGTRITFGGGGGLRGSGPINAQVIAQPGSVITATGPLSLGDDARFGAVTLGGELRVGASQVQLKSDSAVTLGPVTTIAGGTLSGPASNTRVFAINGIPKIVHDEVPLVLGSGAELDGFGVVASKLVTGTGSRVTLTGDMQFVGSGFPDNTTPVFDDGRQYAAWDGELNVGSHTATFSGDLVLGGTTVLGGGEVAGDSPFNIGVVTGEGSMRDRTGLSVKNLGSIRPGGSGAGEIRVYGGLSNNGFVFSLGTLQGVLELDIAGDPGAPHDLLRVVTGNAYLAGSLVVGMLSGAPEPFAEYPLIITEGGFVSGEFTNVSLPPNTVLVYRDTEVVLVGSCIGDFNADGGINGEDVGAFFAAWEASDASADVNQDGGVDGTDVDRFFEAWEAGSCV